MAEALFIFIQMEFPWALGPPDGRYLLRSSETGEPQRVVVLGTVGAARAADARAAGRRALGPRRSRARGPGREASPEPEPVPTCRATLIDPVPVAAEQQARAWLEGIDREHEVLGAFRTLNGVLHMHRIAAADPHVHEVSPAQALVIRAGWGAGEQVADGRWLHASELPWLDGARGPRRRGARRSAALRPVERLAALLGAKEQMLVCEELALRARSDLEHGRARHAALELERAYSSALGELRATGRADLALRMAELEQLRPRVAEQARAALAGTALDEDALSHALARLEAALRAHAAGQH